MNIEVSNVLDFGFKYYKLDPSFFDIKVLNRELMVCFERLLGSDSGIDLSLAAFGSFTNVIRFYEKLRVGLDILNRLISIGVWLSVGVFKDYPEWAEEF